jgi:hypothetical protein
MPDQHDIFALFLPDIVYACREIASKSHHSRKVHSQEEGIPRSSGHAPRQLQIMALSIRQENKQGKVLTRVPDMILHSRGYYDQQRICASILTTRRHFHNLRVRKKWAFSFCAEAEKARRTTAQAHLMVYARNAGSPHQEEAARFVPSRLVGRSRFEAWVAGKMTLCGD